MNNKIIKISALLLFISSFSACSVNDFRSFFTKKSPNAINEIQNNADENTFNVKILEKINDGEKIYILGEATSNTQIPVKYVTIKIRLMGSNGEAITENVYQFKDLMGRNKDEFFEKNEPKRFLITLGEDITRFSSPTDFQLELSWGANNIQNNNNNILGNVDNKQKIANDVISQSGVINNDVNNVVKKSDALKMVNLSFEKKLVSLTDTTPSYYFVINGEFKNLSNNVINEISLAVSFKSKLSDNKLNSEEEFLEIKGIELTPQSSKKFEMELETILSSQDANIYKPDIKIISFN